MTALHARAPAKINLCLLVGPVRPGDGRHELVSVMDTASRPSVVWMNPSLANGSGTYGCPGSRSSKYRFGVP